MGVWGLGFEVLVIVLLILVNGVFAMSEIAIIAARQPRLQQRAEEGDSRARVALDLAEHPNRFLATAQIGITLVGIFAGAYGGATVAGHLSDFLARFPALARFSEEIALLVVVLAITYLSLVVGELVPKRIALTHPERIASRVAGPMHTLSVLAGPIVKLLSVSTDALLRVLRVRKPAEPPVTEAEITALLQQGTAAGVFEEEEQKLVERVFRLGDLQVAALMTPRKRIVWLDVRDPPEASRRKMMHHRFQRFLVCEGTLDGQLGMVVVTELWARMLAGERLDLRASLRQPLFVPETMRALRLLELFRESGVHLAIIRDEQQRITGLVTLSDLLEEIAGDIFFTAQPAIVRREDGSWLMDASVTMTQLREVLELDGGWSEAADEFPTLGAYVAARIGRIPTAGEYFEAFGHRFEVVDMDGGRVDKVLLSRSGG
ncbi:hemolysin family protein [soil metagenome]